MRHGAAEHERGEQQQEKEGRDGSAGERAAGALETSRREHTGAGDHHRTRQHAEPQPVAERCAIPLEPALAELVMQLLSKRPADRPLAQPVFDASPNIGVRTHCDETGKQTVERKG